MSIYDRDYYQEDPQSSVKLHMPHVEKWTLRMIIFNIALFFVAGIAFWNSPTFADILRRFFWLNDFGSGFFPWQLISSAFLHSPGDFGHVFGNMFSLYIFASHVEPMYPGKKFLWIYFSAAIATGLVVLITHLIQYGIGGNTIPTLGASGVCFAFMILSVMHAPNRMFLFNIPAWLIAAVYVFVNLFMALSGQNSGIAVSAHLGGAAFGYLTFRYFHNVWSVPDNWRAQQTAKAAEVDADMRKEVDTILDKINREGMSNLSDKEKALLKKASETFRDEL